MFFYEKICIGKAVFIWDGSSNMLSVRKQVNKFFVSLFAPGYYIIPYQDRRMSVKQIHFNQELGSANSTYSRLNILLRLVAA